LQHDKADVHPDGSPGRDTSPSRRPSRPRTTLWPKCRSRP